jgi:glycosyltransferase involved in cell wall biosynthesis
MEKYLIKEEALEKTKEIKEADILVGIPSFNSAHTIGYVIQSVQEGLARYFPDNKSVIVNCDAGSTDGTMDIVRNTPVDSSQSALLSHKGNSVFTIVTPYHGMPVQGNAFRTFFEIANMLNIKACAVFDSNLKSITPEWVELIMKPLLVEGYHYVAPLYYRHKYDGTITKNIVYPLTRALYGKRIRHPMGRDCGFSGELARFYLTKDIWETDIARFGFDIWMTTTALANGFKVCQSFLGTKIRDAKFVNTDISSMLYQVVGTTFNLMETYAQVWPTVSGSEEVYAVGSQRAVGLEPVFINLDRMIDKFKLGMKELLKIWEVVLPEETMNFLYRLTYMQGREFHMPDEIWTKIIYSFAIASHKNVFNTEHLIKSLTPLYLAKLASFVRETWESSSSEVEDKIEQLCICFEKEKEFLIKNWEAERK